MSSERPKVVIVGAGFGGLAAAKALAPVSVDVIVLDRQNHHCFQPLLYQVATAALSPAEIAWPIRHMLRTQRNATVLMAEVTGVDLAGRLVQTAAGPISYDYLVIATGAIHSYFGHDEWAEFAPGLKRIVDATRIRRSILLGFERAEMQHDKAEQQRLLTFVIVGGGATGVEMAGAIAEIARLTLAMDSHGAHHPDRGRAARAAGFPGRPVGLCPPRAHPHGRRSHDVRGGDRRRRARG